MGRRAGPLEACGNQCCGSWSIRIWIMQINRILIRPVVCFESFGIRVGSGSELAKWQRARSRIILNEYSLLQRRHFYMQPCFRWRVWWRGWPACPTSRSGWRPDPRPHSNFITCPRPPSIVITCPRPPSKVLTCPRPPSKVITCPRPHSKVITCPKPHDKVITCPKSHSKVLTSPRPPSTVITCPKCHSVWLALKNIEKSLFLILSF